MRKKLQRCEGLELVFGERDRIVRSKYKQDLCKERLHHFHHRKSMIQNVMKIKYGDRLGEGTEQNEGNAVKAVFKRFVIEKDVSMSNCQMRERNTNNFDIGGEVL